MVENDFKDPRSKIDQLIKDKQAKQKKPDIPEMYSKSEEVQKVIDNLEFMKKVKESPIEKEHKFKSYGFELVDLNSYLNNRLWTRGIYTTDKLIRLGFGARLEFLKRYLKKKRAVPINLLWLFIIIIAIVIGLILVVFLLPKFIG